MHDLHPSDLRESEYEVPKMDCPSEEGMIRFALQDLSSVRGLSFDLGVRRVTVRHTPGAEAPVTERLEALGLGAQRLETRPARGLEVPAPDDAAERRVLWILLGLNGAMFAGEIVAGWLAESAGLLADALDMLADAAVYGLGLYAVGHGIVRKRRAARVSGLLQGVLALGLLFEVVRRLVFGSDPEPGWMMLVSVVALAVNVTSLALVFRHRGGGVHMKASYIFSANDVLANVGVILAGALVAFTGSRLPDLVIGTLIAVIVGLGAVRILRLR